MLSNQEVWSVSKGEARSSTILIIHQSLSNHNMSCQSSEVQEVYISVIIGASSVSSTSGSAASSAFWLIGESLGFLADSWSDWIGEFSGRIMGSGSWGRVTWSCAWSALITRVHLWDLYRNQWCLEWSQYAGHDEGKKLVSMLHGCNRRDRQYCPVLRQHWP